MEIDRLCEWGIQARWRTAGRLALSLHFSAIRLMWAGLGDDNSSMRWKSRERREGTECGGGTDNQKEKEEPERLKTEHVFLLFHTMRSFEFSGYRAKKPLMDFNKVTPVIGCHPSLSLLLSDSNHSVSPLSHAPCLSLLERGGGGGSVCVIVFVCVCRTTVHFLLSFPALDFMRASQINMHSDPPWRVKANSKREQQADKILEQAAYTSSSVMCGVHLHSETPWGNTSLSWAKKYSAATDWASCPT